MINKLEELAKKEDTENLKQKLANINTKLLEKENPTYVSGDNCDCFIYCAGCDGCHDCECACFDSGY